MNIGSINIEGLKAEYTPIANGITKETRMMNETLDKRLLDEAKKIVSEKLRPLMEETIEKLAVEMVAETVETAKEAANVLTIETKYYQHPVVKEWYVEEKTGRVYCVGYDGNMVMVPYKLSDVGRCNYAFYMIPIKYRAVYGCNCRVPSYIITGEAFYNEKGKYATKEKIKFSYNYFLGKDKFAC